MRIGLDIVEIERIARLGRSRRFIERVFSREEIRYCDGKRLRWQHYAARFAAKEAVWKALGRRGLALKDISIARAPSGRPAVRINGRAAADVQVSLTHCGLYAAAAAVFVERGR
ncbi:MAG: holo-ACP synthase [Elusimicrobia bacterium]|nr:holo-ACP synthase [Elusimicrobiota bacterium]